MSQRTLALFVFPVLLSVGCSRFSEARPQTINFDKIAQDINAFDDGAEMLKAHVLSRDDIEIVESDFTTDRANIVVSLPNFTKYLIVPKDAPIKPAVEVPPTDAISPKLKLDYWWTPGHWVQEPGSPGDKWIPGQWTLEHVFLVLEGMDENHAALSWEEVEQR